MKKNLISMAVATTLGLAAFSVSAEDMYRGAWYAAPGVSYMNTDSDLQSDNGVGPFLRFGKEVSEHWDIQGGVMYHKLDEDTGIAGAGGEYKSTSVVFDALYMFSRDKFRPFLLGGLGVTRNDIDYSFPGVKSDNKRTSWLAEAGLGAQYLFSDKWGAHADVRYQYSSAKYNVSGAVNGSDTDNIGNTLFNVGVLYRFGEPAPAPAPVVAAVEPPPAPAPAPVVVVEEVVVVEKCVPTFETVTVSAEKLFGFDKSKLQEGAKPILDEVVAKLKDHPEFTLVMVTGHTDRIGSDAYNQKLSEKRANQVKDYLVSQGVDASRLEAVGKGESEPVAACEGVKGKALIECLAPNRRVVMSSSKEKEVNTCK